MPAPQQATIPQDLLPAFADLLLCTADDDFLIGHMASEWTGLGPMLEEDIAVSSIAQDEVAHARELYGLVGGLLGRSADDLAYGRQPEEYRCASLVVRPDEFDWAALIARQFYYDHFDALRLSRWSASTYRPLTELAARIAAEEVFHVHHVDDWIRRLGRANDDARSRIQAALDALWADAAALFESPEGADRVAAAGLYPGGKQPMFEQYRTAIAGVIDAAKLRMPDSSVDPGRLPAGGRRGRHGPQLAAVLSELCEVYRLEPEARW